MGIYQHAAEGLGVEPGRTLFIDDRADNLEGARAYGMRVIQYLDHGTFLQEMELRGFGALLQPERTPEFPVERHATDF